MKQATAVCLVKSQGEMKLDLSAVTHSWEPGVKGHCFRDCGFLMVSVFHLGYNEWKDPALQFPHGRDTDGTKGKLQWTDFMKRILCIFTIVEAIGFGRMFFFWICRKCLHILTEFSQAVTHISHLATESCRTLGLVGQHIFVCFGGVILGRPRGGWLINLKILKLQA